MSQCQSTLWLVVQYSLTTKYLLPQISQNILYTTIYFYSLTQEINQNISDNKNIQIQILKLKTSNSARKKQTLQQTPTRITNISARRHPRMCVADYHCWKMLTCHRSYSVKFCNWKAYPVMFSIHVVDSIMLWESNISHFHNPICPSTAILRRYSLYVLVFFFWKRRREKHKKYLCFIVLCSSPWDGSFWTFKQQCNYHPTALWQFSM